MTEGRWGELLVGVRAMQHRFVRLSGDLAGDDAQTAGESVRETLGKLAQEIVDARAGATTNRWAAQLRAIATDIGAMLERVDHERQRVARELAQAVEAIDRLIGPPNSPSAEDADTNVEGIPLAELIGDDTPLEDDDRG